jgi:hypothetical protein
LYAYGALSAELRSAKAKSHNLDQLLSRLVNVRGFEDASDIVSVLHIRLIHSTARSTADCTHKPPRLIADLIRTVV